MRQKKILYKIIAVSTAFACMASTGATAMAAGLNTSEQTWKRELKAGVAAAEEEIVKILTADDLVMLARQCALDKWSAGKTVLLEADIDLTGSEFGSIPVFSGTFDGQGHTVSGFSAGKSGDVQGFFRYIQKDGVVKNLTVEGEVLPEGHRDTIGGIVGSNSGLLTNCTFLGTVKGGNRVGGIAGVNEAGGQLINCSYEGELSGEHYAGGIAGENLGSIIRCKNRGSIDTTEIKVSVELTEFDLMDSLKQINSVDNVPACTDVGGIAGASSGILQSCENYGEVGYEHVGYNIGGIVGRQSGYLDGCVNEGSVRGRKDVGGIAGQFEPEMVLIYNKGTLADLWRELENMQKLLDTTIKDAKGASAAVFASMGVLSESTKSVKDATGELTDGLVGWADENIGQINDFSARISWAMDQLEPAAASFGEALSLMGDASGQLSEALAEGKALAALGSEAAGALSDAMGDMSDSISAAQDAVADMEAAIDAVCGAIGDPGQMQEELEKLGESLETAGEIFNKIIGAMDGMAGLLKQDNSRTEKLADALIAMQECQEFGDYLTELGGGLKNLTISGEGIEGLSEVLYAAEMLRAEGQSMRTAGRALASALEGLELEGGTETEAGYEELLKQQLELEKAMNGIHRLWSSEEELTETSKKELEEELRELLERTEGVRKAFEGLEASGQAGAETLKEEIAAGKARLDEIEELTEKLLGLLENGTAADEEEKIEERTEEPKKEAFDQKDEAEASDGEETAFGNGAQGSADGNGTEENGSQDAEAAGEYFTQESVLTLENTQKNDAGQENTEPENSGNGGSAGADAGMVGSGEDSGNDGSAGADAGMVGSGEDSGNDGSAGADAGTGGSDEGSENDGSIGTGTGMGGSGEGSGNDGSTGADAGIGGSGEDSGNDGSAGADAGMGGSGEDSGNDGSAGADAGTDGSDEGTEEGDAGDNNDDSDDKSLKDSLFDNLQEAVNGLQGCIEGLEDLLDGLKEAGVHGTEMVGKLSKASSAMKDSFKKLAEGTSGIHSTLAGLADRPAIQFTPLDSRITEQKDVLQAALGDMAEQMDGLNAVMDTSSEILLSDMEAINRQFGVIIRLLRQESEEETGDIQDRFEDVSDESEDYEQQDGTISGSHNAGEIQGDVNVAGIVGSMAVEYDFDPEDDLTLYGDSSLDFSWQTSAVLRSCKNTGEIIAKKDHAGGIVGRMDLGRVSECESYGPVSSSQGSYVGGIAGASYAIIRDCWAKCSLSGTDYIGGIAGKGTTITGCRSLIEIKEGSAFLGTIAGWMDEDGQLENNTYVNQTLAAVDNISYADRAEPVTYDEMMSEENTPEMFRQFELTFVADEEVVAVVPFQYGKGISGLPKIPAKEGYSAKWPDIDYSCLTFSQTLEAEYVPYESALAAAGEVPQLLVDGNFSSEAVVEHDEEELSFLDDSGKEHEGTAVTVRVEDPILEAVSYTIHYRLPEQGKKYRLWVKTESGWEKTGFETDGAYLLLNHDGREITFLVEAYSTTWILVLTAGGVILILAALLCVKRAGKGRKGKRKKRKISD